MISVLSRLHGIDISMYDLSFLNKSLQKRLTHLQYNSTEDYCQLIEKDQDEGNEFLESLHISYSEYFRNSLTFAVLEQILLPDLVMQRKRNKHNELRFWSAACAGGQEAYSLAILLEEIRLGKAEDFSYRIFATDQSEIQVNTAKTAHFPSYSLNNMNLRRVQRWFVSKRDTYTVIPELQEKVMFSVFDLFDPEFNFPAESIFGDFDLVFCANLLFYYKNEYRDIILKKVSASIRKGGYLVAGEAERDIILKHDFSEIFPHSAIFKKNT